MTLEFWPGQPRGRTVGLFIPRGNGGGAFAGKDDELSFRHSEFETS